MRGLTGLAWTVGLIILSLWLYDRFVKGRMGA